MLIILIRLTTPPKPQSSHPTCKIAVSGLRSDPTELGRFTEDPRTSEIASQLFLAPPVNAGGRGGVRSYFIQSNPAYDSPS
jgi:hypothetical protein